MSTGSYSKDTENSKYKDLFVNRSTVMQTNMRDYNRTACQSPPPHLGDVASDKNLIS